MAAKNFRSGTDGAPQATDTAARAVVNLPNDAESAELGASTGALPGTEQAAVPPLAGPAAPEAARFSIVGLEASAGGLELTEILQRTTTMPVLEVLDQMRVEPDKVCVIPPNRDMAIFNGSLQIIAPTEPRGQRLPINAFLRSVRC